MDFGRALATSFAVGSNRKFKDGETDETDQIGWGFGLIGLAILIAVQTALIVFSGAPLEAEVIRDLGIVTFGSLALPFILFWLGALITRTMARLPAAFLFLGIALAILQVVSAVLSSFGTGQSGFVIGLLFAVTFLAARGFLKLGWFPAIIIGVLTVAGFIGAGVLFLLLPSGQALQ